MVVFIISSLLLIICIPPSTPLQLLNDDEDLLILQLFKCPGPSNISEHEVYSVPESLFDPDSTPMPDSSNLTTILVKFKERAPDCASPNQFRIQNNYDDDSSNTTRNTTSIEQEEKKYHLSPDHKWFFIYHNSTWSESIPPERYCVQSLSTEFVVNYCRSNCEGNDDDEGTTPCISKCCYAHEVYNIHTGACEYLRVGQRTWIETVNEAQMRNHSFVHYDFDCRDMGAKGLVMLHTDSLLQYRVKSEFKIDSRGSALVRTGDGTWIPLQQGTYCLDGAAVTQSINDTTVTVEYSGHSSDTVLYYCRFNNPHHQKNTSIHDTGSSTVDYLKHEDIVLYKVLVPISTVFILMTVLIYILTWPEQNIHGYSVLLYLVTLLSLYILLIVVTSGNGVLHPRSYPTTCAVIAGAIHFTYLSSICWLTSISFDVWRNFKLMKLGMDAASARRRGKRRLVLFCIFSFGYPMIQVGICFLIDAFYRNDNHGTTWLVIPDYGGGSKYSYCTLSQEGITYYMYIPIGILLSSNVGLFCATLMKITESRKNIRDMFSSIAHNSTYHVNQSFGTYIRLFVIMGIFWIAQFIAWFVMKGEHDQQDSLTTVILNSVIDGMTVLQAIVIFYIFVCKKEIFAKLYNLNPWLRPLLDLFLKLGCCTIPPQPDTTAAARRPSSNNTLTRGSNASRNDSLRKDSEWSLSSSSQSCGNGNKKRMPLTDEDRTVSVTSNSTTTSEVTTVGDRSSWNTTTTETKC